MAGRSKAFVICLKNDGYAVSLERRKLYVVLADAQAAKHGQIRIVDESGADYLYPQEFFAEVESPQSLRRRVLQAAEALAGHAPRWTSRCSRKAVSKPPSVGSALPPQNSAFLNSPHLQFHIHSTRLRRAKSCRNAAAGPSWITLPRSSTHA